ncbi:MAG: AAC(3) family N-acetyltransferase [Solobacterium sp.]|nr:AAC(3) family N-acetyltransferase [Solobacterium sp.]
MSERKTVTDMITKESFKEALYNLGVEKDMILEVHTALSSFGYVVGGARTIVDALLEIAEDGGTILMPVQTGDNTEPSNWSKPPVLPSLWKEIRDAMPAYDSNSTDLRGMGAVVENFRHRDGVVYSNHPYLSYAAWGRYAKLLCNRQSLHFPLAEESPAARLYELKGYVLLLGAGFNTCTCMHLAQYRAEARPIILDGSSIQTSDGKKEWKKYLNLALDVEGFEEVGEEMRKKGLVKEGSIGSCHVQFFSANKAIDEATKYYEKSVIYDLYR